MMGKCVFFAGSAALAALVASGDAFDDAVGRARELCAKMTLEEKAGELMVYDYNDLGTNRWSIYKEHVDRNAIVAMSLS